MRVRSWHLGWVALLGLAGLFTTTKSAPAVDAPQRVAVLTAKDDGRAPAWRATAISDSVSERLRVVQGWVLIDRAQVTAAEESAQASGATGEALRANIASALKADIVIDIAITDPKTLSATLTTVQKQGTQGPKEITASGEEPVLGLPAALAQGAVELTGAQVPATAQGAILAPEAASLKAFELFAKGAPLVIDNPEDAEKLLRSAIKEDKNYARALAALSKAICFQTPPDAPPESLNEALSFAEQAVSLAGASPEAHLALGRVHDFAGRPNKAVSEYSEVLKLSPYEVTALNNRGKIRLDVSRQFRAARQDFETALTANPEYTLARINLARAQIALGEGQAASDTLTPLIEAPPAREDLKNSVIKLYIEALSLAGRSGPALDKLNEFEKQSQDPEVPYYKGLVQSASENYPDAIKSFEQAVTANPTLESKDALAWAKYKNGAPQDAIAALKSLTSEAPKFIPASRDLGILQAVQGDLASAKKSFSSGLEFAPDDPELSYNAAVAALALGDLANAEKLFTKATEIDPLFAQAWYNLGVTRAQARQEKAAKEAFEKAVLLSPEDVNAKIGLALSLRASGDKDGAKKALQEAATSAKEPTTLFQAKLNLGLLCAEQNDLGCAKEALRAVSQGAPPGFEESAAHAKKVLEALQGSAP